MNSLSSLALKLGSPGVVDTFQGEELFLFRLVDPDNRRPADFAAARTALEGVKQAQAERDVARLARSTDGSAKLLFLREALRLRQRRSRGKRRCAEDKRAPVHAPGPIIDSARTQRSKSCALT